MNRDEDGGDGRSALAASSRYLGLGLQFAASIGFFLWVGWWVDGRLATTPLFTILGAFVGAAGGFYSMYHHLTSGNDSGDDAES